METALARPDPLLIIQQAVQSGIDPDKLGKLLDLQERYERNRALEAFNRAMTSCQLEMPAVVKDAENKGTHSTYARLETVNTVIRPVYTRNGFSISFSEGEAKLPDDCRVILTCRHCEGHVETRWYDIPRAGAGAKGGQTAMNATQGKGATFSYGCRYSIVMYFNLTIAGQDTDGQGPYISGNQIGEINELLEAISGTPEPWDLAKFLELCQVSSLNDLPARDFDARKRQLEIKLSGARKRASHRKGGAS